MSPGGTNLDRKNIMPTSKITEAVSSHQKRLLEEWIREQLAAGSLRSDLISEAELRGESSRFLNLMRDAFQAGSGTEITSPIYKPVLEMLCSLSGSRSQQGFSPSETAMFVFSFKQPLQAVLSELHTDPKALMDDSWNANILLDKLGLYTTECYQKSREEVIRRQQEEMLELSTPVVQLWDGVVALPLIGTLDSARTSVVMETLLEAIVRTRSQIAIIDITGVPTVDTLVAQHLLKTVAAARLMGADCIISGIRPQIAQTMVHLQIDLSNVITKATMAEAFTIAMQRLGCVVSRATKNGATAK